MPKKAAAKKTAAESDHEAELSDDDFVLELDRKRRRPTRSSTGRRSTAPAPSEELAQMLAEQEARAAKLARVERQQTIKDEAQKKRLAEQEDAVPAQAAMHQATLAIERESFLSVGCISCFRRETAPTAATAADADKQQQQEHDPQQQMPVAEPELGPDVDPVWASVLEDGAQDPFAVLKTYLPARLVAEREIACPPQVCLWLVRMAAREDCLAASNLACLLLGLPELDVTVTSLEDAVQAALAARTTTTSAPAVDWRASCRMLADLLDWCGMDLSRARVTKLKVNKHAWGVVEASHVPEGLSGVLLVMQVCLLAKAVDWTDETSVLDLTLRTMLLQVDPVSLRVGPDNLLADLVVAMPEEVLMRLVPQLAQGLAGVIAQLDASSPMAELEAPAVDRSVRGFFVASSIAEFLPPGKQPCELLRRSLLLQLVLSEALCSLPAIAALRQAPAARAAVEAAAADPMDDKLVLQSVEELCKAARSAVHANRTVRACDLRALFVMLKLVQHLLVGVFGADGDMRPLRESVYAILNDVYLRLPRNSAFTGLLSHCGRLLSTLLDKFRRFQKRGTALVLSEVNGRMEVSTTAQSKLPFKPVAKAEKTSDEQASKP